MTDHRLSERFFVSFPESLVGRPMVYEVIQRFSVVPNIRRANVEEHSGWMILELAGEVEALEEAVAWLIDVGCTVNRMEGDVVEG
ncbi:MAG: NIL domain-containing protein [Acidimicrobiia bacterium]|nr:NIL domain-containing protein [Acidimicrobiia bacterium]